MPRHRSPLIVAGVPVEIDAPGLAIIERPNGRREPRWIAGDRANRLGYAPKTVRLHFDLDDRADVERMAERCRLLQTEMLDWIGDPARDERLVFDSSLSSLIKLYEKHPQSPYHTLRANTKRSYKEWLTALDRQCGGRRVDRITGPDLRIWFEKFREPTITIKKGPDGKVLSQHISPPHNRWAYGIVRQAMRILVNFGMELRLDPCYELDRILGKIKFRSAEEGEQGEKRARKRRIAMTYEQAEAIVVAGIKKNTVRHRSVALGIAAHFEFAMSQIDVIGEWEKIDRVRGVAAGAIISRGQVWRPGLRYEDFKDGVLDMDRNKTSVPGIYDVTEAPLFLRAIAAIPEGERSGPLVVDAHGIPIRRRFYAALFRELADAAGVPIEIKSMHGRHGAASEADAAGVDEDDIGRFLQHSNPSVTRKHYIKGSVERSRRTQRARVASRDKKKAGA